MARTVGPTPIAIGALGVAHVLGPPLRVYGAASERRVVGFAAKLSSVSSWTEPSFAATLGFGVRSVEQGL